MGVIRSGVVVFVSSMLFLSLFLGGIFLTLDWSLDYDTIHPSLSSISNDFINETGFLEAINDNYELMLFYCQERTSFNYSTKDFSIDIPCEVIREGTGPIINYGIDYLIKDIYYKEYNCSFFECIKESNQPYVLISLKAKNFWHSKFYLFLSISIILFVLMLLFFESKASALMVAGILAIIAAVPFKNFGWLLNFLPDGIVSDIIMAFFAKSYSIFIILMVVGIPLLLLGIAFKFLGLGIYISKFFGLFKKKEIKSEDKDSDSKNKKGQIPLGEKEVFTKEDVKDIVKEEVEKAKL